MDESWRARLAVDAAKVRDYLLSETHPVGRTKATFFVSLGYRQSHWRVLQGELMRHGREERIVATEVNLYGEKYIVEGWMQSPSGASPLLRTVWFAESGVGVTRLVTAYPVRGRRR